MYLLFCFKRKIGTKVAPKAFGEHVVLYYLFIVLKPFLKEHFLLTFSVHFAKGQIKPKVDWRAIDSHQNEQTNLFCLLFCSKKTRFVSSFFGRIYSVPKLLSVLSDLYKNFNFKENLFHCTK